MLGHSSPRLCLGSGSMCPRHVRIHPSPISMELDPGRLLEIVGWCPEVIVTCACVDSIPGPPPDPFGTFARRGSPSFPAPSSNATLVQRRDPFSHTLTPAFSPISQRSLLLRIRGSRLPFHRHFRGHRPRWNWMNFVASKRTRLQSSLLPADATHRQLPRSDTEREGDETVHAPSDWSVWIRTSDRSTRTPPAPSCLVVVWPDEGGWNARDVGLGSWRKDWER